MRPRLPLLLLALAAPLACSGPDDPTGGSHSGTVSISTLSGGNQSATVGNSLDDSIKVKVVDASGHPVQGATVTWAVTSGSATLSPTAATTDANGTAGALVTLGATPGGVTIESATSSTSLKATFAATAVAATYDLIPQQYVEFCLGVQLSLVARLFDKGGVAVTGKPVHWKQVAGSGLLDPSMVNTTTSNGGYSSTQFTVGTAPGPVQLQASAPGASHPVIVSFQAVSPCPVHVQSGGGGGQIGNYGEPLARQIGVRVINDSGYVLGKTVSWQVVNGGGSLSSSSTVAATGSTAVTFTPGSGGPLQAVRATVAGSPDTVLFTENALDPARAPVLVASVPMPTTATYLRDTFVRDGLAFLFAWDKGVLIYDVGNGLRGGSPANPQLVSQIVTNSNGVPEGAAVNNGWWFHNPVTGEKRYLFVGQQGSYQMLTGTSSGDIHILDVSNLGAPVEVGFIHIPGAGPHNFWMDEANQVLYAAYNNAGVARIDVSGVLAGDMSNRIVKQVQPGGAGGTFTWGVMLSGGSLFALDARKGLWALDPVSLALTGAGGVPDNGQGSDLWVTGDVAYTGIYGCGGGGGQVLLWNVIPAAQITRVPADTRLDQACIASDLVVTPDAKALVVTAEGGTLGNGIYIFDRVDPRQPVLRGRVTIDDGVHSGVISVINGRTYLFAAQEPRSPRLLIYDITDVVP